MNSLTLRNELIRLWLILPTHANERLFERQRARSVRRGRRRFGFTKRAMKRDVRHMRLVKHYFFKAQHNFES